MVGSKLTKKSGLTQKIVFSIIAERKDFLNHFWVWSFLFFEEIEILSTAISKKFFKM